MALKMASPFKRPETGVYYFRKAVPHKIRHLVGKTEEYISLGTSDAKQARILFLRVAAEVQERWDALIADRPRLSKKHIQGLAGEFYRWLVAKHDKDPGKAEEWLAEAERDRRIIKPRLNGFGAGGPLYYKQVKEFLDERKLVLDDHDVFTLAYAAAPAGVQAKEQLARNAKGDYSPDPAEARFPKWEHVEPDIVSSSRRLTLTLHWDDYVKERMPSAATIKRWRPILEKLAVFAGSDDLAKVTTAIVLKWKTALLNEGLSPMTVKEVNIAAVRNFFSWAVDNNKIAKNPAEDVKIHVPKNYQKDQGRAFEDGEVRLILSEALRPKSKRTTDHYAAAKRWVPCICAYTGARVNEITQLRREDVTFRKIAGGAIWVIVITPEAGTTKTNKRREVPIHPHLVDQGFLKFVESSKDGPLFYDPKLAKTGSRANPQYAKVGNKIAEWVRDIGVGAADVQPNHGWRHTFQRVAQSVRMDPEIRDAIKGHAPRTEGEKYGGDPPMDAKWREIQLMPRFPFEPPTGPAPKARSHAKKVVPEGAEPPKPGRPPRRRRPVPPKAAE